MQVQHPVYFYCRENWKETESVRDKTSCPSPFVYSVVFQYVPLLPVNSSTPTPILGLPLYKKEMLTHWKRRTDHILTDLPVFY